jgi:hypothetical protein
MPRISAPSAAPLGIISMSEMVAMSLPLPGPIQSAGILSGYGTHRQIAPPVQPTAHPSVEILFKQARNLHHR